MNTNKVVEANEEQTQLKDALLAKRAWLSPNCSPKPVLITAGDEVVYLAMANDERHGMRFTLEEWGRIVEFVDSQTVEEKPAVNGWTPQWQYVPPQFNYVAMDEGGKVFGYDVRPKLDLEIASWTLGQMNSNWLKLKKQATPHDLDWTKSLCVRPGVEL